MVDLEAFDPRALYVADTIGRLCLPPCPLAAAFPAVRIMCGGRCTNVFGVGGDANSASESEVN